MQSYTIQNTSGKIVMTGHIETHADRWARRISRESRISIAHAQAVLQANGIVKEPRDD
jgi:hypothetical protein